MRILHTESSPGWGGQELRILSEAEGLSGRGHAVALAASPGTRIFEEARRRGLEVRPVDLRYKGPLQVRAMRRLVRTLRPDVINTHSSRDSWVVALTGATLWRRPAVVRTRHLSGPIGKGWPTRWLYQRSCDRVVGTAEAVRRRLVEERGLPPEHVIAVPTGIDAERFSPGDRAAARRECGYAVDGLLIGIVGTLRSWKGHLDLLEAFAGPVAERARLALIGEGPMRPLIEERARALGLEDRVQLVGDQRDVVPHLRSLDLFVLPSHGNEGVPQALVQALLCGLPCVASEAGGIPEVLDASAGRLVPPREQQALRRALLDLIEDEALRARLAGGARSRGLLYEREGMLDAMEEVFAEAIARRAR